MKLTIYESLTVRILLRDAIEEYEKRIKLFNGDTDKDMDYFVYYNLRIEELQKILLKL
jgi:hypothetical protein